MDKTRFAATLTVAAVFGTLTVIGARATANVVASGLDQIITALKKD